MNLRSYIFYLIVLFLAGCNVGFPYKYDHVKIQKVAELSDNSIVVVSLRPTIHDWIFGAPIRSGSPYVFDACYDDKENVLPNIGEVEVFKNEKRNHALIRIDKIQSQWIDHGAVSCTHNFLEYDLNIENNDIYCMSLKINGEFKKTCWQFMRMRGKDKISLNDVMNQ